MMWVRLECGALFHPKTVAGDQDSWALFGGGLCYCNLQVTDGVIPKAALTTLIPHEAWGWTSRRLRAAADKLVATRRWIDDGDHWLVHDYAIFQEEAMRTSVDQKRENWKRLKAEQREKKRGVRAKPPDKPDVSSVDTGGHVQVDISSGQAGGHAVDTSRGQVMDTGAGPRLEVSTTYDRPIRPTDTTDEEKKSAAHFDLWSLASMLRDVSGGRISLTLLGSSDGEFARRLAELAAQGWTEHDFRVWAELAARGEDDWWSGEYTTGALLGRPDADGTRSAPGLLRCLEHARARAVSAARAPRPAPRPPEPTGPLVDPRESMRRARAAVASAAAPEAIDAH